MPAADANRRARLWMLAAFAGGVTLHLAQLPPWTTLGVLLCIAWSLAALANKVPLPGKRLRLALVAGLTGGVLAAFHTLNGLGAGTALLALMGAVKLLETRSRRDGLIVIAVAFCLALSACLASQSLPRAPLYLAQVWLCVTAFAAAAHPQLAAHTRRLTALSLRSLLLALPLAVAMFLLFPRLTGGFWSISDSSASTGLSDTMSPGSISELGEASDPVFRAWFQGEPPPPPQRYWRGPVLHEFDGYTWRRVSGPLYPAEPLEYTGTAYHYRVRLEPDAGPWWLALDTIRSTAASGVTLTADRQLVAQHPANDPVTYEAVSYSVTHSSGELSHLAQRLDTRLPPGRNLRSVQLAQQLRAAAPDAQAFINRVLNYFRHGGFTYTLTPPLLDLDSVDDFLFNTREGFCGHYASAFVTLMRAGGVPARVVTGYHGGEWNPLGGYLLVRRSDAHAWAEVWLQGQGWVRVDPTAVVAPERLQRGALDVLPNAGSVSERLVHGIGWLNRLHQSWDATNAWWSTRFIGFDYRSQSRLLSMLGFENRGWEQLGALLATALGLWLLAVTWGFNRMPRSAPQHRLARAYALLCTRLGRAGFPRAPHQGPMDYARSLDQAPPALREAARALLARYARLRYGPGEAVDVEIERLEHDVRRLRVAHGKAVPDV